MGGAQEPGRLSGAFGPPREVVWLIGWLTDRDCWLLRDYFAAQPLLLGLWHCPILLCSHPCLPTPTVFPASLAPLDCTSIFVFISVH